MNRQLGLFKEAKRLFAVGHDRRALAKLDTLDSEFKNGLLAFESLALRSKCLSNMGRYAEATTVIDTLLEERRPARQKADLLRFLGDVQVHRGMCEKAVDSYREALGLGLRPRAAEAAKQGIERCKP